MGSTFREACRVKFSTVSEASLICWPLVAAWTPPPIPPPLAAPMAAPLPPPAIPPMMAPMAAPAPTLAAVFLPREEPSREYCQSAGCSTLSRQQCDRVAASAETVPRICRRFSRPLRGLQRHSQKEPQHRRPRTKENPTWRGRFAQRLQSRYQSYPPNGLPVWCRKES